MLQNITDCFSKFLSHPTLTKTTEIPVNASVEGKVALCDSHRNKPKLQFMIQAFPKLTICLNSQQSISKIKRNYPDKYEEILAGLPFLYGSYGDNHGERFRDFRRKDRSTLGKSVIVQF